MAYFSNSSDGSVLDAQCSVCLIQGPCPILATHLNYNYKQIGNDLARTIMNELVNEEGDCQMFALLSKLTATDIEQWRLEREGQLPMFSPT